MTLILTKERQMETSSAINGIGKKMHPPWKPATAHLESQVNQSKVPGLYF